MDRGAYNSREWRALPRDGECVVSYLLGPLVGSCSGARAHHHIDPSDEDSRTLLVCAGHHARFHRVIRLLDARPSWKRCPHSHTTREGREACERRLNRDLLAA